MVEKGKVGIEFDKEAQKNLDVPLGERELYPSTGSRIAEILKEQDIKIAFGVPGGHIWHFIDPISRIGIKTITFAHEQNAVYTGEAYSQVTQKPAVCYGTVGPGTGNAFSPMQQAYLSCSPIIFLAGGHEVEHDDLSNTIQESYAHKLFEPITKWSPRVHYPHQVKQFVTRAFKIAQNPPMGPVALEFGIDTLFIQDEYLQYYWGGFFPPNLDYVENWRGDKTPEPLESAPTPEAVANAAEAITKAEKPFLIIGDQPSWDQAREELTEFVELMKMPFNTRRLGRAVVSEKHPNCCRGWPPFKDEIDLVVSGGVKVGFFDGYAADWPDTIQISNNEKETYTYIKTVENLLGNTKQSFKLLNEYIKENGLDKKLAPGRDEWLKRCQDNYADAMEKRKQRAYRYGADHPRYKENDILHHGYMSQMIQEVNEELYDNKVRVMIDGYTMSDFVMPFLQFERPASCITANDQAGVGHGVGQAIGAAFGDWENDDLYPVLALMGDSGMMNAGMDIDVAVRYKLPIVYLVTNNGGWMPGMKYVWYGPNWDMLGPQDQYGNEWRGIMQEGQERPILQFEKFAEFVGAHGMVSNRAENFKDDLKKAYEIAEKGQPVILNCHVDQHLCNRAIMSPAYCLMYVHLPYHELPFRGKSARRNILRRWFPKITEEPEMAFPDSWDALTDEEFGYEPKFDKFR